MVPSLMLLTLITSPWLLSAISFHGSRFFHSFYISDCFLAVHLVLRRGSFLFFALSILPLYPLLISGPNSISNLCLYTNFKSTSPLLIFLLVLSPTISLFCYLFCKHETHTKLLNASTWNFILCQSWQCHHICPCQDHLLKQFWLFTDLVPEHAGHC